MRPVTHALLLMFTTLLACSPTQPTAKSTESTTQTAKVNQLNQQTIHALKEPRLIVQKSKRILQVFDGKNLVRQYPIALGFNPKGTKSKEGDGATPEGNYYITHKNPNSNYYLSLGISYPNTSDAERGLKSGLIDKTTYQAIQKAQQSGGTPPQKTALGGDVFIHGRGSSRAWTWGCVALDDADMKELFSIIPEKTPIQIQP